MNGYAGGYASEAAVKPAPPVVEVIAAGAVGNILEWYDFAVYGYLVISISRNFFPMSDPSDAVIAAFGVYAAAFMMRPVGAVLFGHIGDRLGRRFALNLSVVAMALSTFVIGLLPTHASIGAAAPVLLVVLRMIQGVCIGGEFSTSTIYLVEQSPSNQRGFSGATAPMGKIAGTLLGSLVALAVASSMSRASLIDWGWRIPFLLGIALGAVALVFRRLLPEDDLPQEHRQKLPLADAFATDWRNMIRGLFINLAHVTGFYMIFVYLVTFIHQMDHLSRPHVLQINSYNMVLLLLFTPAFGALSDLIGRKWLLVTALVAQMVLTWPLFMLFVSHDATDVLIGQTCFAVLIAAMDGTIPAMLVEMFTPRTRCTALSLTFNASAGLFGGTAPLAAAYLVHRTQDSMAPAFLLIGIAAVSLLGAITVTDRTGGSLR